MTILSSMLMLCFCVTSAKAVGIVRMASSSYTSISTSDKPQVPPWGHTIEIPAGITHVSINVGPNKSPISLDGKDNLLILVDPLTSVVSYLQQHVAGPHVLVYQAAISNVSGTAVFHEYNTGGLSSSLSSPAQKDSWNQVTSGTTVQVHTLKELIDAIPSNLHISFLKTDMQGYDCTAIKSAGNELKRVKKIMSETYQDGKPTYANTVNEYNRDWVPYMNKMGFSLDSEKCIDAYVHEPNFHEMDCHWKRSAVQSSQSLIRREAEVPSEWKTIEVFTGHQEALGKRGQMHSQVGQDWLVATLLGCKSDGWFVDLAANDAMKLSNTLMLERDFAWKGLCVEANMNYMYGLSHRKCKVVSGAVGASDEAVRFTMRGVRGGIVGDETDNKDVGDGTSVNLRTVPLGDIFAEMDAPTVIDYFSLDVEGAESIVMQGFPWDKYRFSVITVERPKPDLQTQLTHHGYQRLRVNSAFDDETWISTTMPNFTQLMQTWGSKQSGEGLRLMSGAASNLEKGMQSSPTSCMIEKGYAMPAEIHLGAKA